MANRDRIAPFAAPIVTCTSLWCVLNLGAVQGVNAQTAQLDIEFIEACIHGNAARVEALLKQGANPNAIGKGGRTGLDWAAGQAQLSIIRLLIERGANVNARADDGRSTPLLSASSCHEPHAAKLLLAAGAKPDGSELAQACWLGRIETVKLFLDCGAHPDAGIRNAAQSGRAEIVQLLLDRGANVNARSAELYAPLHMAAQQGGANTVEVLLRAGADPNAFNAKSETPLHVAIHDDRDMESVKLLVNAGARLDTIDREGSTPVRLAARCGAKAIYYWLVAANGGMEPAPKLSPGEAASPKSNAQLFDDYLSNDPPTYQAAVRQLAARGKSVIPEVRKRIETGTDIENFYNLLVVLGTEADSVFPLLEARLAEPEKVAGALSILRCLNPAHVGRLSEITIQQAAEALFQAIVRGGREEETTYAALMFPALGETASPQVLKLLKHANPKVRLQGVTAAYSSGELVQAELLNRATTDSDRRVRLEALGALSSYPRPMAAEKDALLGILKKAPKLDASETEASRISKEREWHDEAIRAAMSLARFGPSIVDDLLPLLSPLESPSRLPAVTCLVSLAEPGIPRLIALLAHEDRSVAIAGAVALNQIGLATVPALAAALGTANEQVTEHVSYTLWRIGARASAALPALITVCSSDQRSDIARIAAARAALTIDPAGSRATPEILAVVPALIRVLDNGTFEQQGWAAEVARDIGPGARNALPALRARLTLPGNEVNIGRFLPGYVQQMAQEAIAAIEQRVGGR